MTIVGLMATLSVAQAAQLARDTVIVRQLSPQRSGVEQLFFYASGLTSLLLLAVLVLVAAGLIWMRRAARAASERVDELLTELRPMLKQAADTGESIQKTVALVQDEVRTVTGGVHDAGDRVKRTVSDLADRVDDFNDLLGKVHSRADAVVTVAGTAIDGVAWGARKLRERKARTRSKKRKD